MSEQNILRAAMLKLSQLGVTVWRQNTGQAWVGDATRISRPAVVKLLPGDVVIRGARVLHAGLCKGSSDLIGLTPVKITPDHVGRQLAVFTAVEVKNKRGRVTPEQARFLEFVTQQGGLAGVARSDDDAAAIVRQS